MLLDVDGFYEFPPTIPGVKLTVFVVGHDLPLEFSGVRVDSAKMEKGALVFEVIGNDDIYNVPNVIYWVSQSE